MVDLNGSSYSLVPNGIIARASDGTVTSSTDLTGLGNDPALVIPSDGTVLVKDENRIRKLGP